MAKAESARELTELEHCVLGVVWRRGPCSAYVVRREFMASPSNHWSSSTGSIYPLVRRLESLGLVESRTYAWGKAGKRLVSATEAGVATLKRWLDSISPVLAGPSQDLIRTRANFLGVLPREEQLAFLSRAEAATRAQLPAVRDAVEVSGTRPGQVEYWAAMGGLYELRARLAWLKAMRGAVEQDDPDPAV